MLIIVSIFFRTAGTILGTGITNFLSDWDKISSTVNIILCFFCSVNLFCKLMIKCCFRTEASYWKWNFNSIL